MAVFDTPEEATNAIRVAGYPYVYATTPFFEPTTTTKWVPIEFKYEDHSWVRELDGTYTFRTITEIMTELYPGYWAKAKADSKMPYFVREEKKD